MKLLLIFLDINWGCWLPMLGWMLGAFLLGWLLRHLFGGNSKLNLLTEEHNNLKLKHESSLADFGSRFTSLENKHSALQTNYVAASANADKLSGTLLKIEELTAALGIANNKPPVTIEKRVEVPVEKIVEKIVEKRIEIPMAAPTPVKDYKAIGAFYGSKIIADDLKLVEGIGPKIEELFHAAGLKTWAAVAKSNPATLKEILVAAGERYQMHDPGTWPKQCQMMVDDKWAELKTYQEKLDGGKEPE